MKLLAIETATEACSAALYVEGAVSQLYEIAPRQHTDLILPMVHKLLSDAELALTQLDAITFGCGPGAFTGVRLAAAVVQGLALAAGLPVLPVSSLACLAQGAYRVSQQPRWITAMDARMGEIYWATYCIEQGVPHLIGQEQVSAPDLVSIDANQAWGAVGSGWITYSESLQVSVHQPVELCSMVPFPQAQDLFPTACRAWEQGDLCTAEQAIPVYVRNQVATKKLPS